MPKLNDAYRDRLTPEEVIAYEADDEDAATDAIEEARTALAEADAAPAAEEPPEAETEEQPEAEPEAAEAPEPEEPANEPEPEPDKPQRASVEPDIDANIDVAAAKTIVDEAKAKRDELFEQYNDGDLDDDQYREAMDALNDEVATARADLRIAEQAEKRRQNAWVQEATAYLDEHPGLKAPEVIQEVDRVVAELVRIPSLQRLPHRDLMQRVHRKLLADAEITGLDIPPLNAAPPPKKQPKPKAPEPNKGVGDPVATLAKTPASDVSGNEGGEFAMLDRLAEQDPVAYERAMQKMPREKREAYLQAG